jgi:hypothetical protein
MIAALYVMTNGPYFGLDDVDPWDITRDARLYQGPWHVVAHPPCERWGRYWSGGPSAKVRRKLGDDDGCFEAALAAVESFGGVLEHPEASHAFKLFGLPIPPRNGVWVQNGYRPGWSCCVEQGHYGHPARKATWLYYVGKREPFELIWGSCGQRARLDYGYHSAEERRQAKDRPKLKRLTKRENTETPQAFRDELIRLAITAGGE